MKNINDKIKILYKYKTWNFYSKELINNNEIYLSSCSKFNDPFDAIPPFKFKKEDSTPENIYLRSYDLAKLMYPDKSESELEDIIKNKPPNNPYNNPNEFRRLLIEGAKKKFGILSLTSKKDDLLMWSHYANNHEGFCIGYDKEKLIDSIDYNDQLIDSEPTACAIKKIDYSKVIPEIGLFEKDEKDYEKVIKLLTTKFIDWQYEDEYRIFKINSCDKSIKLNDETIKEIILGCKIKTIHEQEIRDVVNKKLPNASILKAEMSLEEFKLIIR